MRGGQSTVATQHSTVRRLSRLSASSVSPKEIFANLGPDLLNSGKLRCKMGGVHR
jgi:hypothetical protein